MRHFRGQSGGLDLELRLEPISKTNLLNFEVATHEFHFFLERDQLLLRMIESQAQKIAEAGDHAAGFRRIFEDERRDRVERVEKEMRVQLHLEGAELRLRELRFQRGLLQLARPKPPIIKKRMHTDNDQRRNDDIDVEPEAEESAITRR